MSLTEGAEVIPMNEPWLSFNPKQEARNAALNEACAGTTAECSALALCPECQALAIALEKVIVRAFTAGQASVISGGGANLKW